MEHSRCRLIALDRTEGLDYKFIILYAITNKKQDVVYDTGYV